MTALLCWAAPPFYLLNLPCPAYSARKRNTHPPGNHWNWGGGEGQLYGAEKKREEKKKKNDSTCCLPTVRLTDRLSMHDIPAITESRIYPASHPSMPFIDRSQSGKMVWIGNTSLHVGRTTCAHTVRYCTVLHRYSIARHCWEREENPPPHSVGTGDPHHQPASTVPSCRYSIIPVPTYIIRSVPNKTYCSLPYPTVNSNLLSSSRSEAEKCILRVFWCHHSTRCPIDPSSSGDSNQFTNYNSWLIDLPWVASLSAWTGFRITRSKTQIQRPYCWLFYLTFLPFSTFLY